MENVKRPNFISSQYCILQYFRDYKHLKETCCETIKTEFLTSILRISETRNKPTGFPKHRIQIFSLCDIIQNPIVAELLRRQDELDNLESFISHECPVYNVQ